MWQGLEGKKIINPGICDIRNDGEIHMEIIPYGSGGNGMGSILVPQSVQALKLFHNAFTDLPFKFYYLIQHLY